MNRFSSLTGVAAAAGLLLAAAPTRAELIKLDCEVTVDTYNVTEGRDGRDSGSSRGTWRVSVFNGEDEPELSWVGFSQTDPFGMPFFWPGRARKTDYLEDSDVDPLITEDRIEWCPQGRGCDVRIELFDRGSWYRVGRAVIDRRRGTLSITVSKYQDDIGLRMDHIYRGTCAPEPEAQF